MLTLKLLLVGLLWGIGVGEVGGFGWFVKEFLMELLESMVFDHLSNGFCGFG
jgi:hypothetical protein